MYDHPIYTCVSTIYMPQTRTHTIGKKVFMNLVWWPLHRMPGFRKVEEFGV